MIREIHTHGLLPGVYLYENDNEMFGQNLLLLLSVEVVRNGNALLMWVVYEGKPTKIWVKKNQIESLHWQVLT